MRETVSAKELGLPFDQYQRYKIIQEVFEKIRGDTPLQILDVGGCPGTLRRFLPSEQVTIADLDPSASDVCANGVALPFEQGAFDIVVTSDTLEHVAPGMRQQFIGELIRVAKSWLLIGAPFDDPQVVQAEEILQQLIIARYGEPYDFIEEHRRNGLPDLPASLNLLRDAGFDTVVLPNGYLYRWLIAISLWFLLQARFDDAELSTRVNAFYNRSFYRQDNREPSYRKLIVAGRNAEDRLSGLPDLLCAPTEDRPGAELVALQAVNLLVQTLGERWSERSLQAEARLNQRKAEIARLEKDVGRLVEEREAEVGRLEREREAEVGRLGEEVARLEKEREAAVDRLQQQKAEVRSLEEEVARAVQEREGEVGRLEREIARLTEERGAEARRQQEEVARLLKERDAEISRLQEQATRLIEKREAEIVRLENEIARLAEERESEVRRLREDIGGLEAERKADAGRIREQVSRLEEVERLGQELEAEVGRLQEEMDRVTQEKEQVQSHLDLILNSKTWRIAARGWHIYRLPMRVGKRLLRAIRATWRRAQRHEEQAGPSRSVAVSREVTTPSLPVLLGHGRTTYDVIYLASIDWDFRFQRPQHVASAFAEHGHRVFYVSPARFLPSSAGGHSEVKEIEEDLFEVLLPVPSRWNVYGEGLGDEQVACMLVALEGLRRDYQIKSAVTFVLLASWAPLAFAAREAWDWKVAYDCMDEWDTFPSIEPAVLEWEKRLVREGDLTMVTGTVLHDKWASQARKCVLARNGVDFHFFRANCRPNDLLRDVRHPIIGYYGAIAEWLDLELIEYAASQRPHWSFVLLGGVFDVNVSALDRLPNVHLLGNQPYEQMPLYLYHFDVCMIPFKLSRVTHAVDPVKFYEFMSAGKPVVAPRLEEILPYEEHVYLVETKEEFLQKMDTALNEEDGDLKERRVALARENTWDDRYHRMDKGIREVHKKASIIIVAYNNVDLTQLCIESICRNTTYPSYEIIVVDNCSEDGTRSYLRRVARERDGVKVILNATNEGFAVACNQGIRAADGERIVLLNNDTVVTRGWLTTLIGHLVDEKIGLVGPVTNFAGNEARIEVTYSGLDEMEAFAREYVRQHAGRHFDIKVLAFYCVAMRRDLIEEVGLLDEGFVVGLFEDDDYAKRVRRMGYRVVCAEDVFVHHFGQAAFEKLLDTGQYQSIWDANKRYFEKKWGAWEAHKPRDG